MPVSQTWLSELDQKIQERQVQRNQSFRCPRNKGMDPQTRTKCYICVAAIALLSIIVIAVCLATIDYDWDNDEHDNKHAHHEHKDSVNLSVKLDMVPDRSSLQPIEMAAPEGVRRDMGFDHPDAQYFPGAVKVMSDEERIRYERMMHPVPTNFQEFMDNQKFVYHVMDFSNFMPPSARSHQSQPYQQQHPAIGAPLNQDDDEEEENEDWDADGGVQQQQQPFDRSATRTSAADSARIIPSDFLTQQFLESLNNRRSDNSHWAGGYSDSPTMPGPRRGRTGQRQAVIPGERGARVRGQSVPGAEHQRFLNQLSQLKQKQAPHPGRNLDELYVQADRDIEEITQMKQTANFLMTAIGRLLLQKAQFQQQQQQQQQSKAKYPAVAGDKSAKKASAEERVPITTESESKLDHMLDVADRDIAKLSQKTNQTDKLMDLISEMLSSSLSKDTKQQQPPPKTLEEKDSPHPQQLYNGDNFPFLPFFSPVSIQRKEHGGQAFGTEKPGFLFLGEPMVGAADEAVESSTGVDQESRLPAAYSLLQQPRFNGKPLDDHPDDSESGDLVDDDGDEDEDNNGPLLVPTTSDVSHSTARLPQKAMVREKRISRSGMFRAGRND